MAPPTVLTSFVGVTLFLFHAWSTRGYEACGDIVIYSFGKAFNDEWLGQYTVDQTQMNSQSNEDGSRHVFSLMVNVYDNEHNKQSQRSYKLWWSLFRNKVSRWSIGSVVGDEGSVIAYKDSHALHPSEIARQRSLWRVYDSSQRKWIVDQSIHVKCADAVSAFEWTNDCLVLGVTNTNIGTNSRQYHKLDTLDYMKVSGSGLSAKYQSLSSGHSIQHDGTHWNIMHEADNQVMASVESDESFPNGISHTEQQWTLSNGESADYLAVHCEVPDTKYYYNRLREKFEVCQLGEESNRQNFHNDHFEMVVMHDFDEWSFGLSGDYKYFTWSWNNTHDIKIPSVGIGTAGMNNDEQVIRWAVNKYDYELIDSASDHAPWYQNERIIGNLLRRGILQRDSFMVTTKLYAKDQGLKGAKHGLEDSLRALNVDAIDIYLIHHPHCDNNVCDGSWKTSWRVIEDYYFANKIKKYVGVSNFDLNQFHELLDWTNIPISVVQNWFDPFHQNDRDNLVRECQQIGIVYQAYSLLGTQWKYIGNGYRGNKDPIFTNEKLKEIASHYPGKSVAQLVLKWALQHNIAILPSSSKEERIQQNINIFDFELSAEDMQQIDNIH